MTERARLRKLRKELQQRRTKTRDLAASFISELRQMFLQAKKYDFKSILERYQDVENAHDELGEYEEDFDEEERKYDILDWQLSQHEGDVVGDLLEDIEELKIVAQRPEEEEIHSPKPAVVPTFLSTEKMFPDTGSSPNSAASDVQATLEQYSMDPSGQLTEDSGLDSVPEDSSLPEEPKGIDLGLLGPHTGQVCKISEIRTQVLDYSRRFSSPESSRPRLLQLPGPLGHARRPKSESDLADMEPVWPNIRAHVREWIMDTLKESSFQKALAKAQLDIKDIDEKTWWDLLKEVWPSDATNQDLWVDIENEDDEFSEERENPSGAGIEGTPEVSHLLQSW
ncbi:hypothetical protein GTA08_BOTSDO12134 [Botryosphaeria dothidea]|uniref:Uncharacterized protein n=1 Tax=Botryosphaeria dothidea TaxID=55169 RepID=A0A8H4NEI5_9PEZI|nr:hypothetical protein GTA08_BOTSDO12134 [Botryosphaeria dothidea]